MRLILLIAVLLSLTLSGCASYIQAVDGYAASAATSAQAGADLNLKRLKFGLCATPVSALVRNPEFAGAIRELCISSSDTSVEDVLSAVEVKQ